MQGIIFLVLCIPLFCTVAQDNPPAWDDDFIDDINNFVEESLDCRHIPGLSLSVVFEDEAKMATGYGHKDREQDVQADEHTRFCIGSLTKAFTATTMGAVLQDHEEEYPLQWDTPVKDVMGEDFRFAEEVRTDRATIRDLLSHKMGLAYYGNTWIIGMPPGKERHEMCSRLRFLEVYALSDFRQEYLYNNWMFLLSSCIMEIISGELYEDLVRQYLLDQLDMTEALYFKDITDYDLVATQYYHDNGTYYWLSFNVATGSTGNADASGGLCTSAEDMTKWMRMQLSQGEYEGEEIVDPDVLSESQTPWTANNGLTDHKRPKYPANSENFAYGLGWEIGDYRGYRRTSHGGLVGGYSSKISLLPDVGLGIYSASTVSGGGTFQNALHIYISDLILGYEPWIEAGSTSCSYPDPWASGGKGTTDGVNAPGDPGALTPPGGGFTTRSATNDYLREPEAYIGDYGHLLLGNISVWWNDTDDHLWGSAGSLSYGRLLATLNPELLLQEFHGDLWVLSEFGSPPYSHPPIVFQTLDDDSGLYQEINGISIDPVNPPIYERGLDWNDVPPIENGGDGGEDEECSVMGLASSKAYVVGCLIVILFGSYL